MSHETFKDILLGIVMIAGAGVAIWGIITLPNDYPSTIAKAFMGWLVAWVGLIFALAIKEAMRDRKHNK